MEARHDLEIVGKLAAGKNFFDPFLQFGRDLIQCFVLGIIGRLFFCQHILRLIMPMRFQNTLGTEGVDTLAIETRDNNVIHHRNTPAFLRLSLSDLVTLGPPDWDLGHRGMVMTEQD